LETIGGTLIIEWEKGEEEDQPIGHSGSVFIRWEELSRRFVMHTGLESLPERC
jgi:hypothetical protein